MNHRTQPKLVPTRVEGLASAPVRGFALALALFAILAPSLATPAAFAQEAAAEEAMTAGELIEKNLDAKGGREKIEAIETARIQGTMTMQGPGGDMSAPFTMEWKAPDQMRFEMSLQGMTLVQAFDGESGWMINPFMGKATAEKMSDEDAEMFKEQADFHGPLIGWEEKGYTVEYAGEEEVEGTPTYKLVVTKPSGEKTTLFLDQEYFLEIKQDSQRMVRGQEVEVTSAVGDYKEVDGLVMAHSMDVQGAGGPGGNMNMTFETVELGVDLPADHFAMPAAEESAEGEGEDDGAETPPGSSR